MSEIAENQENEEGGNGDNKTPKTIPYDRFQEVITERNSLRQSIAEFEQAKEEQRKADEKAERERLEKNQKFEQLAQTLQEENATLQSDNESLKTAKDKAFDILTKSYESQVQKVPEIYRSLLEKMDLLERLEWVADNGNELQEEKPKGIPPSPKPSQKPEDVNARRNKSIRTI